MRTGCGARPVLPLRGVAFFSLLALLCGCSNSNRHIIHQQVAVSRDVTYVEFSRDPTPYIHQGQVGGEHTTYIKVLGFEGDRFTAEMQQEGDAGFTVFSDGGRIERDGSAYRVTVEAPSDLLTIQISARSYGDYVLKLTREQGPTR